MDKKVKELRPKSIYERMQENLQREVDDVFLQVVSEERTAMIDTIVKRHISDKNVAEALVKELVTQEHAHFCQTMWTGFVTAINVLVHVFDPTGEKGVAADERN